MIFKNLTDMRQFLSPKNILKYILFSSVFILSGITVREIFSSHSMISIVWPPSGIALAAILLGGGRYLPCIFLSSIILHLVNETFSPGVIILSLESTLESFIGYWLLHRKHYFNSALTSSFEYIRLVLLGGALSPALSAVAGTIAIYFFTLPTQPPWMDMVNRWMSKFQGILVFTPLILIWSKLPNDIFVPGKIAEFILGFFLTFLAGQIIFLEWFSYLFPEAPGAFILFGFILWGAARFGKHATVLLVLMIIVQSLTGYILGKGFFSASGKQNTLLSIWLYSSVVSFIGMGLSTVLSERRDALHNLESSDKRYRLATSAGGISAWRVKLENNLFESDDSITSITGYMPNELSDVTSFLNKIHEEDIVWFMISWEKISHFANEHIDLEIRFNHKLNYIIWVSLKAQNQINSAGRVISIAGTIRDITDRRVSKTAIWDMHEKYRTLFQNFPTPAYTWQASDNDYILVEYNKAADSYTNGNVIKVLGMKVSEVYKDNPRVIRSIKKCNQERSTFTEEIVYKFVTINKISDMRVTYTYVPNGYIVVVVEDVTQRNNVLDTLSKRENELHTLLENIPDIVARIDNNFKHLYVNSAIEKAWGILPDMVIGKTHKELGLPLPRVFEWQSVMQDVFLSGRDRTYEFDYETPAGKRYYQGKLVPEFNERGRVQSILVIARDVTNIMIAEKEIRENEAKFRAVFENSVDAIGVSYQGRHIMVNDSYVKLFGYNSVSEIENLPIKNLIAHSQRERIAQKVKGRLEGNTYPEIYETVGLRKDGTEFILDVHVSFFPLDNKIYTMVFLRDITFEKEVEEKIKYLGSHDSLTGLPNRVLFSDRLEQAIHWAHAQSTRFALIYADIDHFKKINDAHGHQTGDAYLQSVSEIIKNSLREIDTASRQGGDEFLILLPEIQSEDDSAHFAEKILKNLNVSIIANGRSFPTTASIGIALYPKDGANAETLIKNADMAMYHAKMAGRNQFQFFSEELNQKVLERLELENELRTARINNELFLVFQPIVDIHTGKVKSVETLLRWSHPTKMIVSPDKFIPIAEDSGQINKLGEWVLSQACEKIAELSSKLQRTIKFSVNVSPLQMKEPSFLSMVKRIIHLNQIKKDQLDLEFTESVLIHGNDASIKLHRDLVSHGVTLSVDDFGTGYSSLNYLKQFKINTLKIDKSFIRDILTDSDDAAIVIAIIQLAHNLRLQVTAEGVETSSQLNFLKDAGCDAIQGYYYSKPLSIEDLEKYLIQNS